MSDDHQGSMQNCPIELRISSESHDHITNLSSNLPWEGEGVRRGGGREKEDFTTTQSEKHMPTDFMIFFCNALWKISLNTTKPTILRQKIILIHSLPFISKSCWQVHCSDQFCFLHPSWKVKFKGTKQYSKIKKGHLLVRTPFNVKCMLKSIRVWSVLTTLSISPTLKHSSYTHSTNDS